MSGLIGSLNMASNTILAHNANVATVGKNLANVNTEGYQREFVSMQSRLGGGVVASEPYRADVFHLGMREQEAAGSFGNASARAQALTATELAVGGASGGDLADSIATMFASFVKLGSRPLDAATRGEVLNNAGQVAQTFRRAAKDLQSARSDGDQRIVGLTSQANEYVRQIAELNRETVLNKDPSLLDQRDLAAKKLGELTGATARIDDDGKMRVVLGNGSTLVDGVNSVELRTAATPGGGGFHSIHLIDGPHDDDISAGLGGKIGGEIYARDTVGGTAAADLDQLAVDLATRINALHTSGADANGVAGLALFTDGAGAAVVRASDLTLNTLVAGDTGRVAAAGAGAPAQSGDNTIANAIAALREDTTVASGGRLTAADEAIRIVAAVGQAKRNASSDQVIEGAHVDGLASLRDSVSGVSIEEEMNQLSAIKAAEEAAMRFIGVVNEMLQAMVSTI